MKTSSTLGLIWTAVLVILYVGTAHQIVQQPQGGKAGALLLGALLFAAVWAAGLAAGVGIRHLLRRRRDRD